MNTTGDNIIDRPAGMGMGMGHAISKHMPASGAGVAPEVAFDEPWQAEAFATAVQLSRAGLFTWTEWVSTFSSVIAAQPATDGEDIGSAYYRQWMCALEKMIESSLCISDDVVSERQALWHAAYLSTPHGQPVALANVKHKKQVDALHTHEHIGGHDHAHDDHDQDHTHDHHHHHHHGNAKHVVPKPITVVHGVA